jgi:hypothetical protein
MKVTMITYPIYLESGPRMKTTMIHVPALLGCTAHAGTTQDALQFAPAAVGEFLTYLRSHGEIVDPDAPFTLSIAAHVMEGSWIGYGDPASGFPPDFEPLNHHDLQQYLNRLKYMNTDIVDSIKDFTHDQLVAIPPDHHRPLYGILEHVTSSQIVYLRYLVGPIESVNAAAKAISPDPANLASKLTTLFMVLHSRLSALTTEEQQKTVQHGIVTWTARRCFRRSLEHAYEHLLEIRSRG